MLNKLDDPRLVVDPIRLALVHRINRRRPAFAQFAESTTFSQLSRLCRNMS